MSGFEISAAPKEQFAIALDWAKAEGWNPGLDDLDAFHRTDPEGFLIGRVDGEPVASISVVRYGNDFGFLGFYIVRPDYRGQGYGFNTWQAGLARLAGRTVGLDGVVAQVDNYKRAGFAAAGRNIRCTGQFDTPPKVCNDTQIVAPKPDHLTAILAYEQQLYPAPRTEFLKNWILASTTGRRETRLALKDGAIAGYGTIRQCQTGFKIGPLFADSQAIARDLFASLSAITGPYTEIILDTPEQNPAARALAEHFGMSPVFETMRMYKGPEPAIDTDRVFGITTFELG